MNNLQVAYLKALDESQHEHDAQDEHWIIQFERLQVVPPKARDLEWMDKRRTLHGFRAMAMRERRFRAKEKELEHARRVRTKLQELEGADRAADAVELTEFTQVALSRLRAKDEEEEGRNEEERLRVREVGEEHDAKANYDRFFSQGLAEARMMELSALGTPILDAQPRR